MIQYFKSKSVSFIKFANPPVNCLGLSLREGILRGVEQAKLDKPRAIVLCGEGKNFSAGADIKEFARRKHLTHPSLNEVISCLDDLEVPLVACINGVALGGGLEVALACHWRIASPTAKLGLPEVNLGILPGAYMCFSPHRHVTNRNACDCFVLGAGGTQRLPRLIGVKHALELMTTGKAVSAKEALRMGLLDAVAQRDFAGQDGLVDYAVTYIDRCVLTGAGRRTGRGVISALAFVL